MTACRIGSLVLVLFLTALAELRAQERSLLAAGTKVRLSAPTVAHRQRLPARFALHALSFGQQDSLTQQQPSVLRPIAFGLIGAPVGLVAGSFIGGGLAASAVPDDSGFTGAAIIAVAFVAGAVVGEPWGLACGVHIGNRRHGDVVLGVVASTAVLAAGIGAAIAAEDARVLIAVPIAQIAAAVAVERATAQESPREGKTCP